LLVVRSCFQQAASIGKSIGFQRCQSLLVERVRSGKKRFWMNRMSWNKGEGGMIDGGKGVEMSGHRYRLRASVIVGRVVVQELCSCSRHGRDSCKCCIARQKVA
jgi:hypothetical protein